MCDEATSGPRRLGLRAENRACGALPHEDRVGSGLPHVRAQSVRQPGLPLRSRRNSAAVDGNACGVVFELTQRPPARLGLRGATSRPRQSFSLNRIEKRRRALAASRRGPDAASPQVQSSSPGPDLPSVEILSKGVGHAFERTKLGRKASRAPALRTLTANGGPVVRRRTGASPQSETRRCVRAAPRRRDTMSAASRRSA
jgi:hypothetical protein